MEPERNSKSLAAFPNSETGNPALHLPIWIAESCINRGFLLLASEK